MLRLLNVSPVSVTTTDLLYFGLVGVAKKRNFGLDLFDYNMKVANDQDHIDRTI